MLVINKNGSIVNDRVKVKIFHGIEKRALVKIKGIILHQTGGSSAQSSFNSYNSGRAGAHLLIDKDGTIYQTASLLKQTWHVGKLRSVV
ncbi:MAG: N-acetylmuramoyl-L-alanine amidase [Oleispira antarctica]|nr:N-acetylmuramoyl-L-alanine amidase [Oleispira antarctica]MBQ0793069.1 N-acetylmuramoyl-L-alanine amidase [Oleispira antarctica]